MRASDIASIVSWEDGAETPRGCGHASLQRPGYRGRQYSRRLQHHAGSGPRLPAPSPRYQSYYANAAALPFPARDHEGSMVSLATSEAFELPSVQSFKSPRAEDVVEVLVRGTPRIPPPPQRRLKVDRTQPTAANTMGMLSQVLPTVPATSSRAGASSAERRARLKAADYVAETKALWDATPIAVLSDPSRPARSARRLPTGSGKRTASKERRAGSKESPKGAGGIDPHTPSTADTMGHSLSPKSRSAWTAGTDRGSLKVHSPIPAPPDDSRPPALESDDELDEATALGNSLTSPKPRRSTSNRRLSAEVETPRRKSSAERVSRRGSAESVGTRRGSAESAGPRRGSAEAAADSSAGFHSAGAAEKALSPRALKKLGTAESLGAVAAASVAGKALLRKSSSRKMSRESAGNGGKQPGHKLTGNMLSNVAERMKRIEAQALAKAQRRKEKQEEGQRRRLFNALPKEESDMLQRVFAKFDEDGSGTLDLEEMVACLKEMGLRGTNTAEKREIMRICKEVSLGLGGHITVEEADEYEFIPVDMITFALKVVPQVRRRIGELQNDDLVRRFFQFDKAGSGKIGHQACMEIARGMGLDHRLMVSTYEEIHGDTGGEVELEEFTRMIVTCREQNERVMRQHELEVQKATGLSDELFEQFREDIVSLYQLFERYDRDDSGKLCKEEIQLVLSEFGLLPKNPRQREEVCQILDDVDVDHDGEFSFEEFLVLTRRVREFRQLGKREHELACFKKYDKDRSGTLSIEEISLLLCDVGCMPTTKREQEELAAIIQVVDQDGNGCIDFQEFQVLSQRIDERLNSMRYEEDIEYALRLGFTEEQLHELRWVFDALDEDDSNKLDLNETRQALGMMNKQVSMDAFESAFAALDSDGSGELEFKEFLDFMRLMRDGEGIFSEDATPFARTIKFLETRVLRRILEYIGLSKSYISALSKPESMELVCNFLGIGPMDDMPESLGITSIGELFDFAKRMGVN